MKLQGAQVRATLDRPAANIRIYLFHGSDEAAAYDHAARLGRAVGADAERVDLDGGALKSDPGRLADEAAALSLFGEARWIRVTGATEDSVEAVTLLLSGERVAAPVAVIAPGVRTSGKLVKLAIDSPAAAAISCYAPEGQSAERIAAEIARAHGLQPVGSAARRLAEAGLGDRAVMTREAEKLALFLGAAPDRVRELGDEALDAIGADLGDTGADTAIAALLAGGSAALGGELRRLDEAGVSPISWLRQMAKRLILLAELRLEAEAGRDPKPLMKRRGVHFSGENALAAAARRWTGAMLAEGLERVRAAERDEMTSATAGPVLAQASMLNLARRVERRG